MGLQWSTTHAGWVTVENRIWGGATSATLFSAKFGVTSLFIFIYELGFIRFFESVLPVTCNVLF